MSIISIDKVKSSFKNTDFILLIFLLLFTNQAIISVKILGLIFVYIARPNLKFGLLKGRLPLFYLIIILLSIVNLFVHVQQYDGAFLIATAVGNLYWIFCFLAYHQVKLSIEKNDYKIHTTLKAYALINILFCVGQLVRIMIITKTINPYSPDIYFPYGISTGDNIYGLLLENSYFNIMISSMLTFYFLFKKDILFCLINVMSLLLSFGNMGTIIIITALTILFILSVCRLLVKGRLKNMSWLNQVSVSGKYLLAIPGIFLFIIVFYLVLSPGNIQYTIERIQTKISHSAQAQMNEKFNEYAQNIHDFQKKRTNVNRNKSFNNTEYSQQHRHELELTNDYVKNFHGKQLAFKETFAYLESSEMALFFGAGNSRFSSLNAARFSGFDSSRLFRKILPGYLSPLYDHNHRLIHVVRLQDDPKYYATINWPDSFYNQILGEYGLIGVIIFILFYVWFFVKRIRNWSYGLWLCILIAIFSYLSYMFEALCVMVFFELLMELDMRSIKSEEQYE